MTLTPLGRSRKLTRATLAIARERTITAAAQAAMMQGECFAIDSPLELAR